MPSRGLCTQLVCGRELQNFLLKSWASLSRCEHSCKPFDERITAGLPLRFVSEAGPAFGAGQRRESRFSTPELMRRNRHHAVSVQETIFDSQSCDPAEGLLKPIQFPSGEVPSLSPQFPMGCVFLRENNLNLERWLSGRKRRIANPVGWETALTGSNPVLSADAHLRLAPQVGFFLGLRNVPEVVILYSRSKSDKPVFFQSDFPHKLYWPSMTF